MNISYKWLKRYINLQDNAETVAKILTSIGLEVGTVEEVETIKGGLRGLVIGQVLTCEEHPNSDHLHITQTQLAPGEEPVQIVCGAPNVAAGQKVIVATLGTTLYDGEEKFVIKKSKIRGVESFGMICAEDEIGVGAGHDGIMVLPEDVTVGTPAADYFHVESDYLIEVDITPNRADAISHYGVARDLYAYYQAHGNKDITLTRPSVEAFKVDNRDLEIAIEVQNPVACPRYSGVSITGVEVKESPEWLQNALRTIGLRPINNIVDATNFVLHSIGQPMHAFDADHIAGKKVVVRNAAQGDKFVTLDEVERTLDAADLMICCGESTVQSLKSEDQCDSRLETQDSRLLCIAGVFGGLHSGVTESTKNVFLESAYFNPVSVRKTARRQGLNTDASFRYERGCDPNITIYALQLCALLIQEIAGGQIAMEITDVYPEPVKPFEVDFSIERCNRLIGKELGEETILTILDALEIRHEAAEGALKLLVPPYRVDVQRECDVIEDILRIYGYNNVEFPEKLNSNLSYSVKPDSVALQRRISEQLTAQGFNEILNNSLTKTSYYEASETYPIANSVRILNPLSQDLALLRQSLLFGGLESIQRNVNRQNADLKFYEFGNAYRYESKVQSLKSEEVSDLDSRLKTQDSGLSCYTEETHLGLWITGNKAAQSWTQADQKTTFYQLRAYVNAVLKRLGVNLDKITFEPLQNELFADGLKLLINGKEIGFLAIVNHKLLKQFDIDNDVFYADLSWKALLKQNKQYNAVIEDLAKFPEVKRDFALLVDKTVVFEDLRKAALQTAGKLLKNVYLFDVYEGKNLPAGKKSYALSFILQDPNNTLKDQQIENTMARLKKTFEDKFGATLR